MVINLKTINIFLLKYDTYWFLKKIYEKLHIFKILRLFCIMLNPREESGEYF